MTMINTINSGYGVVMGPGGGGGDSTGDTGVTWNPASTVVSEPIATTTFTITHTAESIWALIDALPLKEKVELFNKFSEEIGDEISLLKGVEMKLEKRKSKEELKGELKEKSNFIMELENM